MRKEKFGVAVLQLDPQMTVANAPPAADNKYALIFVSDGASGSPCLAVSDGTNWKQVAISGTSITAT